MDTELSFKAIMYADITLFGKLPDVIALCCIRVAACNVIRMLMMKPTTFSSELALILYFHCITLWPSGCGVAELFRSLFLSVSRSDCDL